MGLQVAIYTSIMAKNMHPVLHAFDEHYLKMTREGRYEIRATVKGKVNTSRQGRKHKADCSCGRPFLRCRCRCGGRQQQQQRRFHGACRFTTAPNALPSRPPAPPPFPAGSIMSESAPPPSPRTPPSSITTSASSTIPTMHRTPRPSPTDPHTSRPGPARARPNLKRTAFLVGPCSRCRSPIPQTAAARRARVTRRRPAQGAKEWDTVRDLGRVWADPRVRAGGFGPDNTLMVEAEERKARGCRGNAVLIEEYTRGQARQRWGLVDSDGVEAVDSDGVAGGWTRRQRCMCAEGGRPLVPGWTRMWWRGGTRIRMDAAADDPSNQGSLFIFRGRIRGKEKWMEGWKET